MSDADDTPLFHLNEGSMPLDVPGVWEDKTIHVLRLPGDGHAAASLVVTREALPLGMEVPDYVEAEMKRLATTLPDFAQMGRVPIEWEDVRGEAIMTRWRSSEGLMDQIVACRRANGRRLLIFTATHPSPMPTATYRAMIAGIAGFRPRPPGDPAKIAD